MPMYQLSTLCMCLKVVGGGVDGDKQKIIVIS